MIPLPLRRIGVVLLAPALALILWLRLDEVTRDTIWAEDGRNFLQDALAGASVVTPYGGYLHLVPRTIADVVVAFVPPAGYALAITALTCLVAGIVGALVYAITAWMPISRPARLALALVTVLVPALPVEVAGNAANLHSLFLWLAPWLFLARPTRWWQSAALGLVAVAATLTEIQMVIFLPLFLVQLRDRRRWPILGGAVAGIAAQFVVTVVFPRLSDAVERPAPMSNVYGWLLQVGGGTWFSPVTRFDQLVVEYGWNITWLLSAPIVLLAIAVVIRGRGVRALAAVFLVASVVIWAVGFGLNTDVGFDYANYPDELILGIRSLRYSVVPSMLLISVIVFGADRLLASVVRHRGFGAAARTIGGAALATAVVAILVVSVDATHDSRRSAGPVWSTSVADAAARCEADDLTRISIQTAPALPTWHVTLQCDRL